MKLLLGLLAAVTLAGCDLTTGPKDHPTNPATETFAETLGVNIATMTADSTSGYITDYYRDIKVGTGAQLAGDAVVGLDWTAYVKDGTVFDIGSIDVSQQEQTLDGLILGLQVGMQGMKIGGERLIVIPSEYGFQISTVQGSTGYTVPPNTTVIYDVKLTGLAAVP